MINTVADFLYQLQQEQEKVAEAQGITHRVTIGEMYERIAGNLLEKAIFTGYNINVISRSFIKDKDGKRSKELDLMIIEGEGEPIPLTDRFDVKFEQVIAVIQIKKTLNLQQLEDGYMNLYSVYEIAPEGVQQYQADMFNDAYRSICRQSTAVNGKIRKTFENSTAEGLYEILKWEAILPARILFAFNGFQTEKGLRDSFYNFLAKQRSTPQELIPGFGPLNFPNLIVNDEFILIKNNGLPFVAPLDGADWDFYTSARGNPYLALLEIVWTRLTYRYGLSSDIFGEDLQLAGVTRYLTANTVWVAGQRGWNYHYTHLRQATLGNADNTHMDWSPVLLNFNQFHIINYLCAHTVLKLNKIRQVLGFPSDSEVNIDELIRSLLATGLVYISGQKHLRLLTDKCQTMIMPDGNYYAADNKTGRMTRWSLKFVP
ncbi:DUF6602 domain-containing protein [Mucilaginibacter ximonensis]|uniref:DUF6602 domain-containing protein n=1 Tax=Mucilaginibacter ximonensis TaxID=538021 RepID=A0ABW5Y9S9_9SPHI